MRTLRRAKNDGQSAGARIQRRLEMARTRRKPTKPSWWTSIPTIVKEIAGVVTAIAAIVGGLTAIGVIGGGDGDTAATVATGPTTAAGSGELPTVVRFESDDPDYSERGFFTPAGMIISTGYSLASDLRVVWTSTSGTEEARVELVERGGSSAPGAVLLELVAEEPPPSTFAIRNAQSLTRGEEVTAHLGSSQSTPGEVIETRATATIPSYGAVSNLIATTSLGTEGEGGAPLLDAQQRVIGMLFARNDARTFAIPIEDLRREFPRAFPP